MIAGPLTKIGGKLIKKNGKLIKDCSCCDEQTCLYCENVLEVDQFSLTLSGLEEYSCESPFGFGTTAKSTIDFRPANGVYIYERSGTNCEFRMVSTTAEGYNGSPLGERENGYGSFNFSNFDWPNPPSPYADKWGGAGGDRTDFQGKFSNLIGHFGGQDPRDSQGINCASPITVPTSVIFSGGLEPPDIFNDAFFHLSIELFEQPFDCNDFEWDMGATYSNEEAQWEMTAFQCVDGLPFALSSPFTPNANPPAPEGCEFTFYPGSAAWGSSGNERVIFKSL